MEEKIKWWYRKEVALGLSMLNLMEKCTGGSTKQKMSGRELMIYLYMKRVKNFFYNQTPLSELTILIWLTKSGMKLKRTKMRLKICKEKTKH